MTKLLERREEESGWRVWVWAPDLHNTPLSRLSAPLCK